jgi:hypothetical protein
MRKIKKKSLVLVFLAALLLIGAPQAMALNIDAAVVVGLDSASGTVDLGGEDLCMAAIGELINEQRFDFKSSTPVGSRTGGPDLTAYLFLSFTDVVTLYCAADVHVGGGNGPGGNGPGGNGPGGPGPF